MSNSRESEFSRKIFKVVGLLSFKAKEIVEIHFPFLYDNRNRKLKKLQSYDLVSYCVILIFDLDMAIRMHQVKNYPGVHVFLCHFVY